jgi:site-specific DNA-methyltransferase (adenine-specific)
LKDLLPNNGAGMTSHQQLDALDALGEIHFSESGRPKYKQRVTTGTALQDIWAFQPGTEGVLVDTNAGIDQDVKWLDSESERLGYPTQKPLGLLERIINASSNPGDIVLDPFCGCGTAVHAAEKLGRRWVGIDVTHLAISLVERRLKDAFPNIAFEVLGTPRDLSAARDLAARDKHQLQWWAVSLLDAVPQGGKKKGADRGIDGIRWVRTGPRDGDLDRVIISVKGGENVSVRDVRDLAGTVQREGALGGVLITLADPTRDMLREAASHGYASTGLGQFRKIMVKTIAELMAGVHDDAERLPPIGRGEGFRAAPRERSSRPSQAGLFE